MRQRRSTDCACWSLDHDAEARELLRTVLQQRGAVVQTAASVADALESLKRGGPTCWSATAESPQHESYALVGKVHALDADRGGRIPRARADRARVRTDPRLGQLIAEVQRDLPKPVEPAVLTAEIARLAGRERRRAQR